MKLLLLRCPTCQQPLQPGEDDVVVVCAACATAVSLGDNGVAVVEIQYAQPNDNRPITHWFPMWLFNGQVNLLERTTQGGSRRADAEAEAFWSQPKRLYVPAWELPVPQARQMGRQLLEQQPVWRAGERPSAGQMVAAVLTPEDALKLLDFIILTVEAERSDWLKNIEFTISAPPPTLWAIPSQLKGDTPQWLT